MGPVEQLTRQPVAVRLRERQHAGQIERHHIDVQSAEHFVFERCDHEARVNHLSRGRDAELPFEPVVGNRGNGRGLHPAQINRHAIGHLMVDRASDSFTRQHGHLSLLQSSCRFRVNIFLNVSSIRRASHALHRPSRKRLQCTTSASDVTTMGCPDRTILRRQQSASTDRGSQSSPFRQRYSKRCTTVGVSWGRLWVPVFAATLNRRCIQ